MLVTYTNLTDSDIADWLCNNGFETTQNAYVRTHWVEEEKSVEMFFMNKNANGGHLEFVEGLSDEIGHLYGKCLAFHEEDCKIVVERASDELLVESKIISAKLVVYGYKDHSVVEIEGWS